MDVTTIVAGFFPHYCNVREHWELISQLMAQQPPTWSPFKCLLLLTKDEISRLSAYNQHQEASHLAIVHIVVTIPLSYHTHRPISLSLILIDVCIFWVCLYEKNYTKSKEWVEKWEDWAGYSNLTYDGVIANMWKTLQSPSATSAQSAGIIQAKLIHFSYECY